MDDAIAYGDMDVKGLTAEMRASGKTFRFLKSSGTWFVHPEDVLEFYKDRLTSDAKAIQQANTDIAMLGGRLQTALVDLESARLPQTMAAAVCGLIRSGSLPEPLARDLRAALDRRDSDRAVIKGIASGGRMG